MKTLQFLFKCSSKLYQEAYIKSYHSLHSKSQTKDFIHCCQYQFLQLLEGNQASMAEFLAYFRLAFSFQICWNRLAQCNKRILNRGETFSREFFDTIINMSSATKYADQMIQQNANIFQKHLLSIEQKLDHRVS